MNDVSNQPILDRPAALQRMGGDEELYREIVAVFCDDTPIQMQKLRESIAAAQILETERLAHSIKSACASIGASRMSAAAFEMERDTRAKQIDRLEQQFGRMQREWNEVVEALNAAGYR